MKQQQFLKVVSREEAQQRFDEALQPRPLGAETVELSEALGRIVATPVVVAIDVPPFDRSTVDGYALRAADVAAAAQNAPQRLRLTGETIACGTVPTQPVAAGMATAIATGGPIPRGADAVVMVEHTDADGDAAIIVRRPVTSGQNLAHAGSDLARGEVVLRRGTLVGSREIGLMAACGIGQLDVHRRPRVAVISTGDELVAPGQPLPPAAVYDTNGPIVAAAVAEHGGEPVRFPAVPDDEARLSAALAEALASCDMVILSGGTSKGAGDYTARLVGRLGEPGIVVHGVALKPGKPLCLAVAGGKPVVVLPGFPTSAVFTFQEFVAPVLRRLAGWPAAARPTVPATVPVALASERGRTEYVMVALTQSDEGLLVAHPVFKSSGAISAFAQADGFVAIGALADGLPAGTATDVTLLAPQLRIPDLVIAGSHCIGLEPVIDHLAEQGIAARVLPLGSLGGLAALRRGECDIAPIHLYDAASGSYNRAFIDPGLRLVEGWRRRQGIVFRRGDARFEARDAPAAVAAALADPDCLMVNRNPGAGTRVLLDQLLGAARPDGYQNQLRSHNAVAAAVAQGRADWGMAIDVAARAYGLGFLPYADEHYDFAVAQARASRPAVAAFTQALADAGVRQRLTELGFALP